MGQLDNIPSNPRDEEKAAREALRSVTQDLRALQHDLSGPWTQDIARLQGMKSRLLNDIEILEEEYQSLRNHYEALKAKQEVELSRQQLAQQQLWAKRLAQALASHLQTRLTETIYNTASINGTPQNGSLQNVYQLLASLDASLNDTLHSLQQDLNSYQSSLSQQISRMHSMEQQGEVILDALINRLSLQLQTQVARPQVMSGAVNGGSGAGTTTQLYGYHSSAAQPPLSPPLNSATTGYQQRSGGAELPNTSRNQAAPVEKSAPKAKASDRISAFQRGLIFIILSTIALSTHNVLVGIIGYGGQIFGQFPVEGILPLNIPNSLRLLCLRMVVVLPLMALVAGKLYPNVWQDIRQFLKADDKRPIFQVVASGCFLFMSQVLIYKSISEIGPGVAVTLLFMYPLITVPLAWFLFGDRPTSLRTFVMFCIAAGVVLTFLPEIQTSAFSETQASEGNAFWGVLAAILSSASFALYLISMQLSFRKLHPVPVSLVQFTTIFVLTSLILLGGSVFGLQTTEPSSQLGLYLGGALLGVLTLAGYLCNNYGVRLMGAAQASIIASSGPVLTVILALFIIPNEEKSLLEGAQIVGVILVTLGVLALSVERLSQRPKPVPKRIRS